MNIAVLSCILGNFDTPVDPVPQNIPVTFHRWSDENFPPITGLSPRLHKEQYAEIQKYAYADNRLYASTSFIYKNNAQTRRFLEEWWAQQSRFYTCDQVVLPFLLDSYSLKVKTFNEHIYKTKYMSRVSTHK
jgi:hypothetical protein